MPAWVGLAQWSPSIFTFQVAHLLQSRFFAACWHSFMMLPARRPRPDLMTIFGSSQRDLLRQLHSCLLLVTVITFRFVQDRYPDVFQTDFCSDADCQSVAVWQHLRWGNLLTACGVNRQLKRKALLPEQRPESLEFVPATVHPPAGRLQSEQWHPHRGKGGQGGTWRYSPAPLPAACPTAR